MGEKWDTSFEACGRRMERRLEACGRRLEGSIERLREDIKVQMQQFEEMLIRPSQSLWNGSTANIQSAGRYDPSFLPPPFKWNEYEKEERRPQEAVTGRLQEERFGDQHLSSVVEEFYKVRQIGSVREYELRFEELKALMLNHNPYLTEAYFVLSFLMGLKEELRRLVKVIQPKTVKQAVDSARFHEFVFEEQRKEDEEKLKERANKEAKRSKKVEEAEEVEEEIEEEKLEDGDPLVGSLPSTPTGAETSHAINFQKQQMKEQKKPLYQVFEDKEVGTYFYIALEIGEGWPNIDEKVDMHSLSAVFVELQLPFVTRVVAVGKRLKERVAAELLISSMHRHSSCMKTHDIAGTYRSAGKENLCMEISKNILQVQKKQKRMNTKAKRKQPRRRKREKEIKQTVRMGIG